MRVELLGIIKDLEGINIDLKAQDFEVLLMNLGFT